ncbi:armadillo-type protein [Lipomyces tetrasporus]|uniref:Armadillo-type protein n=1 Tax=Lipomyces tetrasporus TaxID=54092 RepID=A0AAD7QR32_9ASCO|nr:armadillo-type protein [Lipomyces tetrasporus]KAJ8099738.1 armadillo-type protein [Lipomyces tetrasporus]
MQGMASPAPGSPKHRTSPPLVSNVLPMPPSNFIHRFVPMSPKLSPMRMSPRKPTWQKLYNDDDDVFGGVPVEEGTVVRSPTFLDSAGIDNEFELLLDSRGISEHMRPHLRELDLNVKACLINNDMCPSPTVIISPTNVRESKVCTRSSTHPWSPKRIRRSATTEYSPTKNIVLSSPDSFVEYLFDISLPGISVIAARELKRALRCERLQWMERFLNLNGIDPISRLLIGLTKLEWREDKDDRLFLELMHCLRTISEFEMGRDHITTIAPLLFPKLIDFMFSDSQPTYFADRGLIVSVIVNYIAIARPEDRYHRCKAILSYLEDPTQPVEKLAPTFIEVSHRRRPYRNWCLECSHVVRDVFWIFVHTSYHIKLIAINPEDVFARQGSSVDKRRSASGHISDVEWDAIEYLASHIELLNLIVASVPTQSERNGIRKQMKDSGFDSLIGKYLRASSGNQSKSLHNNLETLIALAFTDGWNTEYMRTGMRGDGELAQVDNASRDVPTLPMKTLLSQDLFSLPEVDIFLSGPESRTFEPVSDPWI